ncbi:hypothetical protein PHET_07631 [Paragonimus heterotremus]|uniref:RWD domain-containing protein n=1 Tax=Paragonimus heterotremus TaxID=100268 RepID=A0A8J4WH25_9TREM|nr:hypothetical protein PHET_07631 [Paragonimus heterotremus]
MADDPQTDLVTLSVDRTLRIYPIHFAFVRGTKLSEDVPVDSTDGSNEKHPDVGGAVPDSSALFVAQNAPTATTGRRQPGSMSGFTRHKHLDGQQQASRIDDSVSRPTLVPTDFGNVGGTKQNDAYRLLEQELSLLSPRAGQYKLEETDLINRNVKLQLWYCRRQHYHHHTICSVVAGVRDRRPSAEMEDLDSLLLLPSEIPSTLDGSVRADHQWRTTVERSKSFGDLEFLSGDEWQPQNPSPISRQKLPVGINSHTKQFRFESPIPLAGTVTLCVNFPLTYPSSTPVFNVLEHRPCLPEEVIECLYQVLQLTASDLAQMSRGCMDPCIRKAIDLLQNISPARLSTPSSQLQTAPYELDALQSTLPEDADGLCSRPGSHTWKQLGTENKHHSCTPFPRTSGVHFTPQGLLVTFGLPCSLTTLRTSLQGHVSNLPDTGDKDRTPRTYADFCRMRHLALQIDHVANITREPIPSVSKSDKPQMKAERDDRLLEDPVFDSVDHVYTQLESNVLPQSMLAPDAPLAKVIPTSDVADLRVENPGPIQHPHEYYRSTVQLYDLSAWIMHKKLTRAYSLNSDDVQQMCSHNYLVAMETGRKDLLRFWQYAIVLSASMVKFSRGSCGIPVLPAHSVGKWMFNEWLSYFLRLHDVQHLTMVILVLQGLDALYGAHLRSPPASRISTFEYTQTENFLASPSKQFVSGDTYTDRDPASSENYASPIMATVSFNLDMSDELPEGLTPVNENHTNNFLEAPLAGRSIQPHLPWRDYVTSCWRFVSADDLPRFAHYISVYANILHCMGKFLHHARLLRSWTRGLSFRVHGLHDRRTSSATSFKQWPYHGGTVLLLPTCPNCNSPTVPAESDDFGVTRIQCADCLQSFQVPSGVHSLRDILTMNTRPTPSLQCSICRTQARGLVFICPVCYHGGHVDHLLQWFARVELTKSARQCPSLDCTCCCVSVLSTKTILQT